MEITGSLNSDFSEQEFVVQINLNGFWEEFYVCAESREEALKDEEVADRLKDSDYAPLVRPAIYQEWDNEKSFYLNGTAGRVPAFILSVWADGFGNWHGKATFSTPLGNTPEANRVANNAKSSIRRAIRQEILTRSPRGHTLPALRYTVTANTTQAGSGCLTSITMSEQGNR